MAITGSGLGGSIGAAAETTFGTFVAPGRWLEFESESVKWVPKIVQGKAINGSLTPQQTQRVVTSSMVKGGIKTYTFANGLGLFLQTFFGTSSIAQQGATTAWLQTHTIGNVTGKSLSLQINRPDTTGADHPYSYSGLKITDLKINAAAEAIVELDISVVGQKMSTTPTLTAPAYTPANEVFTFTQGSVLAGSIGSEAQVLSVMKAGLDLKRPFDESRFPMGGAGLMQEPIQNGIIGVGGSLDTEFVNATDWETALETQAPLSLILEFTGAVISGTYNSFLKFAIPNIYFEGDGPNIGGMDIVKPPFKFSAVDDGTHGLITCTYQSTDTTI